MCVYDTTVVNTYNCGAGTKNLAAGVCAIDGPGIGGQGIYNGGVCVGGVAIYGASTFAVRAAATAAIVLKLSALS